MLSINTNLSSLIAQNSMKTSTDLLNQAIERMTTGYKINHASDNAANYSISTNMSTQLSAYDVASDNVAMDMDLVTTAMDTISSMQDKAERLRALCTQARNGTYGAQSLSAINTEAGAIMAEITRLYSTAEYNDISLFNQKDYQLTAAHKALSETVCAKEEYNGFIADPVSKDQAYVDALTSVTGANGTLSASEYKVESVEDLVELANLVNSGVDTTGKTFYLAKDLDIGAYCEANMATGGWTPIGTNLNTFKGTFDGNGHLIKNLKIDRETVNYQGLFGYTENGELKNIGVVSGFVNGRVNVGGLIGCCSSEINNCYSNVNVSAIGQVGSLAGNLTSVAHNITNSYATGDVETRGGFLLGAIAGGLVGIQNGGEILNCYATGNVTGFDEVIPVFLGGLVGGQNSYNNKITNSYATGDVTCLNKNSTQYDCVGGLVGLAYGVISNCYVTGDVTGLKFTGGLLGGINADRGIVSITDSASYSKVNGADSASTGSLIGGAVMTVDGTSFGTLNISNCQSRPIEGMNKIGGAFSFQTDPPTAITFDLSSQLAGISDIKLRDITTNLQVGIYGDNSCQINFDTNFAFNLSAIGADISSDTALKTIDDFINQLSEQETKLGAVQNRLESALESIEVNIENLTSSRSTIRDADIAEVSSEYIRQQILQQASATLMATANQSPAIALQLI